MLHFLNDIGYRSELMKYHNTTSLVSTRDIGEMVSLQCSDEGEDCDSASSIAQKCERLTLLQDYLDRKGDGRDHRILLIEILYHRVTRQSINVGISTAGVEIKLSKMS
jgi:hypothetical protein